MEQFLGSAAGLSAATITRMTTQWQDDAAAFGKRSLAETDYVYCSGPRQSRESIGLTWGFGVADTR